MLEGKNLVNVVVVDVDKQKGILEKNKPLQDYCQSKIVMTRSRTRIFLSVVADGGGIITPEAAAKLAVDTIFTEFERTNEKNLNIILRSSLTAANRAVYDQANGSDYVGITIVAIKGNRLYKGQVGQLTRAYWLSNNKSPFDFALGSERCLGDSLTPLDVNIEEVVIKQGDRVIICSDGLFDLPGKVSSEEKIKDEIRAVCESDTIYGSARHLASIAKGLDANDDITVVILGIGQKSAKPSKSILAVAAVVAFLMLIVVVVISFPPQQTSRPSDLGLAVLFSGSASSFDPQTGSQNRIAQYSLIDPGTSLIVSNESSIDLKLKRRTDTQSTNTEGIPGVDLYLSERTEASLTTLDLASLTRDEPTDPALLSLTEVTLNKGQLLIVSDGSRKYVALISTQQKDEFIQVVLASGGAGILGVTLQVPNLEIYCLQGTCQFIAIKGETVTLLSPGKTTVDISNSSILSANESVTDSDWQIWNSICRGSQPDSPCNLSK